MSHVRLTFGVDNVCKAVSGIDVGLTEIAHIRFLCRIDQDVDDSVTNVESAQAQLLKYFDRISSNRWLVIKIFFVLLLFLLIFVVFIA